MLPHHFLPRDRQFWVFHGSALALGFVVTALMIYFAGYRVASKLLASAAWMPVYTVVVLCFRWLYQRCAWKRLSMGRLLFYRRGLQRRGGHRDGAPGRVACCTAVHR